MNNTLHTKPDTLTQFSHLSFFQGAGYGFKILEISQQACQRGKAMWTPFANWQRLIKDNAD